LDSLHLFFREARSQTENDMLYEFVLCLPQPADPQNHQLAYAYRECARTGDVGVERQKCLSKGWMVCHRAEHIHASSIYASVFPARQHEIEASRKCAERIEDDLVPF